MNWSPLSQAVIDGEKPTVVELTKQGLEANKTAGELLSEELIPAMVEVGRMMKDEEYFLPEVLMSAKAMQGALDILRPLLVGESVKPVGTVVIGTVEGDLHDIGKSLVSMVLEGRGFKVKDLGVNVTAQTFIDAMAAGEAQILGMSSLLSSSVNEMPLVIKMLEEVGLRNKIKIMVGGATVSEDLAKSMGADGYAVNASAAADLAEEFIRALS